MKRVLTTMHNKYFTQHWVLIVPLIIGLIIRLIFWYLIISSGAVEAWDAGGYFHRAVGLRNVLADLLTANRPSYADMALAYSGNWPPIQTLVLSIGALIFGSTLAAGRLTMVLLSSLTIPLVYFVTYKLSNKRAALTAAIIFAIYPSFIHYSVRTFSETTYIFFSFLMLSVVLITVDRSHVNRKANLWAVITGFILGLVILTRAAGLQWIPIIAAWVGWYSVGLKKRFLLPALIIITTVITLLPWYTALFVQEGRVVMGTTNDGKNLYLGNNPFLPEGWGSSDSRVASLMSDKIEEYRIKYDANSSEAARTLALQEITNNPVTFLKRGIHRLQTLFSFDDQLARFILVAVHPPLNENFVGLIFLLMLISLVIFLALAIWGLFGSTPPLKYRELIIALVLSAMATHFIVLGHPRLGLPLLAILSPAVGHGLTHLKVAKKRTKQVQAVVVLVLIVVVSLSVFGTLGSEYYIKITPSSYYAKLVRQLDQIVGVKSVVGDRLIFRSTEDNWPEEIIISPVNEDFQFLNLETNTYIWEPTRNTETLDLTLQSQTAQKPLQIQLKSLEPGKIALISLKPEAWYSWQSTNLAGIEYMWIGSFDYPSIALDYRGLEFED